MNTPHPEDMPEREALTKAYMAFCADKAPDYNEVGFPYFKAAWQARASLAEQRTRAIREALLAVHMEAVHLAGNEFCISRATVDKVASTLNSAAPAQSGPLERMQKIDDEIGEQP